MTEYTLNFDKVQDIYDKAKAIAETLGDLRKSQNCSLNRMEYNGRRLQICAAQDSQLLTIHFDARENTGRTYYSQCLNVSSLGNIEYYSEPHLSEKEAGIDAKREDVYLSWQNWLNDAYKESQLQNATICKGAIAS